VKIWTIITLEKCWLKFLTIWTTKLIVRESVENEKELVDDL